MDTTPQTSSNGEPVYVLYSLSLSLFLCLSLLAFLFLSLSPTLIHLGAASMHDEAIEARTGLRLRADTEQQAQVSTCSHQEFYIDLSLSSTCSINIILFGLF